MDTWYAENKDFYISRYLFVTALVDFVHCRIFICTFFKI